MAVVTSVMVRAWNADSEQPAGADVNVGGEASAVVARTAAILSSKKRCRSCTSIAADSGARPRPISTSTDCHSWRGPFSVDLRSPERFTFLIAEVAVGTSLSAPGSDSSSNKVLSSYDGGKRAARFG